MTFKRYSYDNDYNISRFAQYLKKQVVLKSRRAFDAVKVVGAIPADRSEYYARYCKRDSEARTKYKEIASHVFSPQGIYVIDLIRGNVKNGDARL